MLLFFFAPSVIALNIDFVCGRFVVSDVCFCVKERECICLISSCLLHVNRSFVEFSYCSRITEEMKNVKASQNDGGNGRTQRRKKTGLNDRKKRRKKWLKWLVKKWRRTKTATTTLTSHRMCVIKSDIIEISWGQTIKVKKNVQNNHRRKPENGNRWPNVSFTRSLARIKNSGNEKKEHHSFFVQR